MNTTFVITMEQGDCDDHTSEVVAITHDEAMGNAYVQRQNDIAKSLETKLNHLQEEEMSQWKIAHPRPEWVEAVLHEVPRKVRPTTPAARQARLDIIQQNHNLQHDALAPQRQWNQDYCNHMEQWKLTHLSAQELEMHKNYNSNRWSIAPVAWLEALPSGQ